MDKSSNAIRYGVGSVIPLVAAAWFYLFSGIGENITAQCQVNGDGNGFCSFTNSGWTPGAMCVNVVLTGRNEEKAASGKMCSGRVWPDDTIRRDVSIVVPEGHCVGLVGLSLGNICRVDILDANASPESTPPPPNQAAATNPVQPTAVKPQQPEATETATGQQSNIVTLEEIDASESNKTYAELRSALIAAGYAPDPNSDKSTYANLVAGDPASCGNAGCSIPWAGNGRTFCVGVQVNDNVDVEQWNAFIPHVSADDIQIASSCD